MKRLIRVAPVLAALALACKPEPATQSPEPEPTSPAPTSPELAPEVAGAPEPEPTAPALTPEPPAIADGGAAPEQPPLDPGPAALEELPAALHTKVDARCGGDPGVGTPAKPFNLKTPEGKDISLAAYRGKVVLLNFWGTWCKPCLKELPEFDRLYRRYRKHGLVVIAIATDTEPGKVQDFATERKLATKLALGGQQLADDYQSSNFPFSFVIDRKGQIRGSYRGYKPECAGKLEQDIRTQLEQR